MKYLINLFVVILLYQFSYSKSESLENNNINTLKTIADTSKAILDTNNIIQKSDLGINLLIALNPAIIPTLTYRYYVIPFFSIELGWLVLSPIVKYGASLNYKRLFVSFINYQNLDSHNLPSDTRNCIFVGYIPINTGNAIDFQFRLGIWGSIAYSHSGTFAICELGLKYNFYK